MTKRFAATAAGFCLCLALMGPTRAEAQLTRSVCMTSNQDTCVTFQGLNWVTGGGGATVLSTTATFYGTGLAPIPNVMGIFWNQTTSATELVEIGLVWFPPTPGVTGSAYSGSVTGPVFVRYSDFSFHNDFASLGLVGTADDMTINEFSRFETVTGAFTNCQPIGPIVMVDPLGNEVPVAHAGIFAFLQLAPPTNPCHLVVVPEPGALALIATAIFGVGFVRRRKREEEGDFAG